jgi:hypothetical protein
VNERIRDKESCLSLQTIKLRNREQALQAQFDTRPGNEQLRNQLGRTQSQIWALQNDLESSTCQ